MRKINAHDKDDGRMIGHLAVDLKESLVVRQEWQGPRGWREPGSMWRRLACLYGEYNHIVGSVM